MLNFLIYDVSTQPRLIGVPTYDIGNENKLDAKTEYEQYIKNKNILEFDKILDIDNLLTKNESTAYDELVTDITDPSFYFILAQSDFQPTPHDDCQARQQNIKLIRQDIKRMIDKYDNKTFEEVFYMPDTVDKLDKNKVYDQETSSEFREVHPNSYRNWYSRCCQHEYQTECYIPLVCGKTRFCGNLDSGSTCSVLMRLKHPRFYSHRHSPPVENKFVLPVNTEPYIKSISPEADKEFDAIFNKIIQDVDDRPEFTLEHFINDLDLEHLQSSNKELRNLKKIMRCPDFKLPNYLSHYNHIKNKLSIINNIIYFTKEPYPPVPLLPTNCIISMALRIHDKYSHCGRDKLVDWIRTIAYHVKLSELLNKICTACPICLLKKVHPLRHTPPTIKIQTT
ncbi:unnamed protein product, partial [Rotaria magnacalcarata]